MDGVKIQTADSHKGCPYELILSSMKASLIKRKSPRLKDFDYSQPFAYFVTVCTKDKKKLFLNEALGEEIIDCLKKNKEASGMKVFAFCLMPDHLHVLISPGDSGLSISIFIGSFKSKTTRIGWKYGVGDKMWQARFHDHVVRPDETVNDICEYILNNPVRKKLVNRWEDYKYCGFLDPVPA